MGKSLHQVRGPPIIQKQEYQEIDKIKDNSYFPLKLIFTKKDSLVNI